MVVLDPIKVTITNYEGGGEQLSIVNNPEEEPPTERSVAFSKSIYIERADFMVDPPKKFFRLGPGRAVRLKGAYIIECKDYKLGADGEVEEVICKYYENSKSGSDTSGVKAKGTLHWVSQDHAIDVEVRQYDRLFTDPSPDGHEDKDFLDFYNDDSLDVIPAAKAEQAITTCEVGVGVQFMRKGYFVKDPDSTEEHIVFNRTVTLRDTWKKLQDKK